MKSSSWIYFLRAGVSLVEACLACGVAVVLASLLFPAWGRARDQIATQVIISNLMQFRKANLLYVTDHDSQFVPAQIYANGADGMWFQNKDFLGYFDFKKMEQIWDEDLAGGGEVGPPQRFP